MYILTNKNKTVLYTGVTNNLKERLYYHRNQPIASKSFTSKYNCFYLIYFEEFKDIETAIQREKQIKAYSRSKKESLIQRENKDWDFLDDIV